MLFNTEAVVIKTVRYGETHAIVTLLTPTGRVSAMARSAMKPQSKLRAGVSLCAEGTYSIYQGRGLGNIQQVDISTSRRRLHENLESAAYAAYFCDLVMAVGADRPEGDPAIYRQFRAALDALIEKPSQTTLFARVWEAKVCAWLGASPDWRLCGRCTEPIEDKAWYHVQEGALICARCRVPEDVRKSFSVPASLGKILYLFERTSIEKLGDINIHLATQRALEQTLYHQLTEYAGLYLKSRDILKQLANVFGEKEE